VQIDGADRRDGAVGLLDDGHVVALRRHDVDDGRRLPALALAALGGGPIGMRIGSMVEDPRTGADGNDDAGDDPDIFAFHSTPCAALLRSIYYFCAS